MTGPASSGEPTDAVVRSARRWRDQDPDPATRAVLDRLMSERDPALAELFSGRLAFGTAGLRAELGPGPVRMNRLVVRQTTAGVLRCLRPGATVVVGYDARHGSAGFATDTAAVVAAAGGQALVLPHPTPTPVLAHAVLDHGADAGVMITASHNPPADNGYKLYLGDGLQIVPPADAEIAAAIEAVAAEGDPPPLTPRAEGRVTTLVGDVLAPHRRAAVAALVTGERDVRVLYTPMHGVGRDAVLAAFEAAGFPPPSVVPEQAEPDADFPTVPFPNPEEPGALDLALARAAVDGPDVVIANDPDADRMAAAVTDRAGLWVRLTGDELGVLLADHLLRHTSGDDRLVATSMVSSRLLSAVAAAHGVEAVVTLTGFKWVARPIVDRPDRRYLFGYEEAIGYCVGDRVRDKDGVSAALVLAELVADLHRRGLTVWDRLDDLAVEHGLHLTGPVTVRLPGVEGMARRATILDRLAAEPPSVAGGVDVLEVEDLALGARLPPSEGVVLHLADRTRLIVRPSGTEPKLKGYVEVIEDVGRGEVAATRRTAGARLEHHRSALQAELLA
jgi:phosphomannomutase